MQPLLAASSLRVDDGRIPAVDGLSLASTGDKVLVLGAPRALFESAMGLRGLTRGELRICGELPLDASRAGVAAGAPLEPPMPPDWTVLHYVTWSARLAGHGRRTARALADEAIDRMKLEPYRGSKLGAVAAPARRGCAIAAAIATGATTLLIEDPLNGLLVDTTRSFARIIVEATTDRRTAVFASRVSLDSPIAFAADEAIVLDGSHVAAQGAPAEIAAGESAFVLRVGGDTRAFVDAVTARGGRLVGHSTEAPAQCQMTVDLGDLQTGDVLRIAAESNAVVLELRPLSRAFA